MCTLTQLALRSRKLVFAVVLLLGFGAFAASASASGTTPSMEQGVITGHVTWEGRPASTGPHQQLGVQFDLKDGNGVVTSYRVNTDQFANFVVDVSTLPSGTYKWWLKSPMFLANGGKIDLVKGQSKNLDVGVMSPGDCNGDNLVSAADYVILRATFAKSLGDPGFDPRADFDGDNTVDIKEFNLLRNHFGLGGALPFEVPSSTP